MKKQVALLLSIMLVIPTVSAYELTQKDKDNLEKFEQIVEMVFEKNPSKSYKLQNSANQIMIKLDNDTKNYKLLEEVLKITNDFIAEYEAELKEKEETEKNEEQEENNNQEEENTDIENNNDNEDQNEQENVYLEWDYRTISSFSLEARIDSMYLENIYMKNIGSLQDMAGIIDEVYLVDRNNMIIKKWYAIDDFIYFDILDEELLDKNEIYNFEVKAKLKEADRQNQTGEIILDFANPNNAAQGAEKWIKAVSYSNWSYMNVNVNISDRIETFVSNTNSTISAWDFEPSYSQAAWFVVSNTSQNRLELDSFEFRIVGSFMNNLNSSTTFTLREKWNNTIFWQATLDEIVNWYLTIEKNWNAIDYISRNASTEYYLEVNHVWNISDWTREVRLQNIVIWDGFGGTIDNLDDYENSWLPGEWFIYRY